MKPFFTHSSRSALREMLSERSLLVFDFDGVLAPVIAARDKAKPSARTRQQMRALARLYPVAIVSGRGRRDVKKRMGFPARHILGNHGLEGPPPFKALRQKARAATKVWNKILKAKVRSSTITGLDIEEKTYSLTVHYHLAPNPALARRTLIQWAKELRPRPRLVLGKNVVNFVHSKAPHKGDGVRWLLKKTGAPLALYIGDDVTDEDAFRLKDKRVFTVRVGRKASSAARTFIPDQKDINRFIAFLIQR